MIISFCALVLLGQGAARPVKFPVERLCVVGTHPAHYETVPSPKWMPSPCSLMIFHWRLTGDCTPSLSVFLTPPSLIPALPRGVHARGQGALWLDLEGRGRGTELHLARLALWFTSAPPRSPGAPLGTSSSARCTRDLLTESSSEEVWGGCPLPPISGVEFTAYCTSPSRRRLAGCSSGSSPSRPKSSHHSSLSLI